MKLSWPSVVLVAVFIASSACVLIFADDSVKVWALEALTVGGTIGAALMKPMLEKTDE